MHYEDLDAFIADLPNAAQAARERMRGHSGVFCLKTKQGRTFHIVLEDGLLSLADAAPAAVDCTVTADEQALVDMLNGRLNPAKALLLRRVSVQGSMGKLMELVSLIG